LLVWFFLALVTPSVVRAQTETETETALDSEGVPDTDSGTASNADTASNEVGPRFPGLRTFVEMSAFLAVGTVWYWLDKERSTADWDYTSWTQRFDRDAFRYDNNAFGINWVWHPFSGSAFYGVSRSNGLHSGWAFAASFLTSFGWEWLLEFRERVSINDQIATPTAGLAIGEPLHRLGAYLQTAPNGGSRGRRALAWLFGPAHAFHRAVDRARTPSDARTDAFGYALLPGCHDPDPRACSVFRRLELSASVARSSSERRVADEPPREAGFGTFELAGRLRLGGFSAHVVPGTERRGWLRDAALSDLRFRAARGDGRGAFEVEAEALLIGGRAQRIDVDGRGFAIVAGTSLAYLYRRESHGRADDGTGDGARAWDEALGIVGLPGAYLDLHLLGGVASLAIRARANRDFAGLHAPSWDRWESDNPDARAKTILIKQGYWYGWGWSTRLELELALEGVSFGGRLRHGRYASDEGLDRSQENVTDDVPGRERMLDADAFLRVGPFGPGPRDATGARTGVFVEVAYEHRERSGRLGTSAHDDVVRHDGALRRVALRVGLRR